MSVKAYAVKGPKQALEPFEYTPGPLGPEEVEVRVTHCGICHSDIAMIDNDWGWSQYPLVPGHEVVGTIAAVGSEVHDRIRPGTRVGVGWQAGSCQRCEWCGRGKENLCYVANQPTIVGHHGGWADSVRCHWKFAVPMPEGLPSEVAGPLMCGGTTVFTPMRMFGVEPWMTTAVVGIGGLGHMAVQFLAKMGCEVTAISSSHDKDDFSRQMGATRFIATRSTDELSKAKNTFDFILSTVSSDLPWSDYVAALRPQGRLVIVGLPESDLKIPVVPLLAERSVTGACAGSPLDTAVMLEFAARTGMRPMVETFPMREVNRGVERVRSGKVRFRGVLVA
jgi:alcohol/geraniol dehydrogenase (NADP+)